MVRCQHLHIQIICLGWMKSQHTDIFSPASVPPVSWIIEGKQDTEEQTLRKQEKLCCCFLSNSTWAWRVRIPIFIFCVYHMRMWHVGRRHWGNNPHISTDIYEPLCMEIAPGQRCKRHLPVKDCGSANLTWRRCSAWIWQSWRVLLCRINLSVLK